MVCGGCRRRAALYCSFVKPRMKNCFVMFISDERAQDLVEYALLLAFVALAGAAALINMGGSTNTLWSVANSRLAAANAS